MSLKHLDVVYGMKLLTSPENRHDSVTDKSPVPSLDLLLQRNIAFFDEALQSDPKLNKLAEWWSKENIFDETLVSSFRWKFVTYCLRSLHILQKVLKEETNKEDQDLEKVRKGNVDKNKEESLKSSNVPKLTVQTLGIQDQKTVKTVLQFIVCLGICPCLQTGVGIPLSVRSGFSVFVENPTESSYADTFCLFSCLKILLQCTELSTLATVILSQHLTDILAGLLQIIHIKKSDTNRGKNEGLTASDDSKRTNTSSDKGVPLFPSTENKESQSHGTRNDEVIGRQDVEDLKETGEDVNKCNDKFVDGIYCDKALENLFNRVYPPLLVKTLLLLQGRPQTKKPPSSKGPMLPPSPVWLRRIINQQLTVITLKPKGVQFLLRGMLDGPGRATKGTADWKRCDAVAKVITCCPLQTVSLETYYKAIGPQIVDLIHLEDKQLCQQYIRIACSCISNMAQQDIGLTRQYVFLPLIEPLMACSEDREINGTDVTVTEASLNTCIEDCHKVFVCGCTDNPGLITSLQPVILTVFNLLVFTKPGISNLKKPCYEIVVSFLKQMESDLGLVCLDLMTFKHSHQEVSVNFPRMHPHLSFRYGANGGITVVVANDNSMEESDDQMRVECVVSIMKDLKDTGLTGEFFVHLLKELTKVIQSEIDVKDQSEQTVDKNSQPLLAAEKSHTVRVEQFYRKLMLLNVLANVCEELGPACIKNATHALEFVKATLERGVQVCMSTSDVVMEVFEGETLSMAMGLLTATLTGAYQLTEANREFMNGLLPLLQEISLNHPESSVQEMATDIRIAIATHGAVWSDKTKSRTKEFSRVSEAVAKESRTAKINKTQLDKPKIEVLQETQTLSGEPAKQSTHLGEIKIEKDKMQSNILNKLLISKGKTETSTCLNEKEEAQLTQNYVDGLNSMNDTGFLAGKVKPNTEKFTEDVSSNICNNQEEDGISEDTEKPKSELSQAYEELCDPLIPVRGHGLIRLTRMTQRRDPAILNRQEAVLTIFLENLDHADSYLYLAAVNGLTALSEICPNIMVPKLSEQFANFDQICDKGSIKRKAELRMKIGEVLVKASRCLGDTIPKYRDVLIQSLLVGAKDSESFVRASSLSNIGEICKLLRFSLGNIIQEVFECCSGLLRYDTAKEVRQAAGQALTLLLQGMTGDKFKVLESVIRDLYRVLKQCMITEKEEGVKLHVTLALNELDEIMRHQLFPVQKLEKRIRVLDFE